MSYPVPLPAEVVELIDRHADLMKRLRSVDQSDAAQLRAISKFLQEVQKLLVATASAQGGALFKDITVDGYVVRVVFCCECN